MNRPINIAVSTSHSQAAEFAALAGVASTPTDQTELANAYREAVARIALQTEQLDALVVELNAEKEAHAATQAALTAATSVQPAA